MVGMVHGLTVAVWSGEDGLHPKQSEKLYMRFIRVVPIEIKELACHASVIIDQIILPTWPHQARRRSWISSLRSRHQVFGREC